MENEQPKSQTVKIVKRERIDRILNRVCSAGLEVLIRIHGVAGVAVRGRAVAIDEHGEYRWFRMANISDQGMAHLMGINKVRIEFVGMTTQVVFEATITMRDQNSIAVEMPEMLYSIERRENARFVTTPELLSFVDLTCWTPNKNDIGSPPIIVPFFDLAGWINIADISEGGFCAVTRFPSVLNAVRRGLIDDQAKIIFPMQPPLPVPLEVRWFKKIKDQVKVEGQTRHVRIFRFGMQFVNPSDEVKMAVKQYAKQLSLATAI